jgi:hypothetical protein
VGEQYRSLSFSLWNFLHSPVTSILLGPNSLLNSLFSKTISYVPPSLSGTRFHTHAKQQQSIVPSECTDFPTFQGDPVREYWIFIATQKNPIPMWHTSHGCRTH